MSELKMLEQLLIENKDVLIRLKESNPENYMAEKIFPEFSKTIDK